MIDRFQVGVIASTHGLAGEVNVFPTTDEPERFKTLKKVTLDTGREGMKELDMLICKKWNWNQNILPAWGVL